MSERAESTDATFWASGDDQHGPQYFRALVATVDGGVFQLDADDRLVAVDDTLLELTDRARETLLGNSVSTLLDAADVDRVKRRIRGRSGADAGSDDVAAVDVGIRTADGDTVPCELRLNGIGTETDQTIGIVTRRDPDDTGRTERRAVAETSAASAPSATSATAASSEALLPALEEADVGVFVLDDDFDIAWINEATERYFEIDRAAVLGRDKQRVIDETIRDRVDDADRFRETVVATYDDNSYVERFECRITPSDEGREERWLEHRSRPIESGPYAGGRVELYYDVTDQRRRVYQLRRLNEAVSEWLEADSDEEAAERACRSLRDILDLDINGVFGYDPESAALRPVALSEPGERLFDDPPTFARGEGIAWRVFETGRPEIYDDVTADPDVYNPETPIRSELVLPIGEYGVVLAGSERHEAFDEGDLSLAMIAASSLEATFGRLENERRLERERAQTERLIQTAPVAISVENDAGEILLENQRAAALPGFPARETVAPESGHDRNRNRDENRPEGRDRDRDRKRDWTITDANGSPLEPDRTPSARVRETGEPVLDAEFVIDGPDGDRTWMSINAAPVFAPDGTLDRVISVGEDITELKEHERRLERRKTELETELSEILGRVSDAFYALDEEWRFTHVNDRAAEILRRSEEELLGRSFWDVYADAADEKAGDVDPSPIRDRFDEAMSSQQRVSFETYAEPFETWIEVNAYPSETGLSVYFRDVAERKERERELAEYEAIVETVEDGIYVLDENERFITVNEAYTDLTGYGRDELLGADASLVADEDTIGHAREIAVDDGVSTIETELKRSDGGRLPVEATVTTLSSTDGERERIGVVRDVTERRRRQRQLEASEQRYRTLAEHFPNGIVALFDDELRYTAAGGQLVGELGIDRETVIGQTIYERYPDELVDEIEPHFRAALEGEDRSFDVTYYDRELRAHTLPIRTGGEVQSGMLVVQDVTDRREYERRLEASNERLEQFAYAASHDLQEPLRMVSSYLQLIDRRYGDEFGADGREFLDYAVDGAERMREMIDGLLEYSRIETQGEPLEPVDLEDVLADVRDDLQLRIEESDADVTAAALPRVRGDAGQLRQVFQNLLDNAIEYSGDDPPEVHISAERDGSTWRVSVADEGIGIEADETERVFDVFQRLHSREEHDGTGIGLTLCKRIVERHDGEIRIDSEAGAGTTVSFTLPAVADRD